MDFILNSKDFYVTPYQLFKDFLSWIIGPNWNIAIAPIRLTNFDDKQQRSGQLPIKNAQLSKFCVYEPTSIFVKIIVNYHYCRYMFIKLLK